MSEVLVIVDMQNDFITGQLGTPEAQSIVPKIVEKINNFDGYIICTMDTHDSNYLQTLEGKNLPVPHCIEYTDGWLIEKSIRDAILNKDDRTQEIVQKSTFASDYLLAIIDQIDNIDYVDSIEFVGVCTDICVVSNALLCKKEFDSIKIFVDASCCAGTTPDKHNSALDVMESCQVNIINR